MPPDTGLYLHWPFCARVCPYCDFNVLRWRGPPDEAAWLAAYTRDFDQAIERVGVRRLVSLYLGGGTPSLLPLTLLEALLTRLQPYFAAQIEITLEANPEDIDEARLAAWAALGINRLSLGVQSLDAARLKFLGRRHSPKEARQAVERALSFIPNTSVDLIFARPGDSRASWRQELAALLALDAPHLSLYGLTIEPGTAFARQVAQRRWQPLAADTTADLLLETRAALGKAGYDLYEVSNAARPGFQSRHNLLYWQSADWIGIGPGAQGRLTQQGKRISQSQPRTPATWLLGEACGDWQDLNELEASLERLLMGLRVQQGVAWSQVKKSINPQFCAQAIEAGWLSLHNERLSASEAGLMRLDALLAELVADAS